MKYTIEQWEDKIHKEIDKILKDDEKEIKIYS